MISTKVLDWAGIELASVARHITNCATRPGSSELVVFDYGLSDTQDALRCLRNGIYNLWLTFSPCDKNSGERFRPEYEQ